MGLCCYTHLLGRNHLKVQNQEGYTLVCQTELGNYALEFKG